MIKYVKKVKRIISNKNDIENFIRLYLIPGMNHCRGGPGVDKFNWIDVIRDWVEVDNLPNTIVGYKFANGNSSLDFNNINLDKVFISKRPIYDYPYTAHYKGKGEINNIDSFMPKPLSF